MSEEQQKHEAGDLAQALDAVAAPAASPAGATVSPDELQALQRAEDAKGDPALDEVEPADIEVQEKEEPFEKLALTRPAASMVTPWS